MEIISQPNQPIKVAVLGSTGMLGNVVSTYFDNIQNFDVLLSYRDSRLKFGKRNFYFDALDSRSLDSLPEVDYVINCIGCVKQRDYDIRSYMKVNAQFPHFLAAACERNNTKLIHITTDCVFSGKDGYYHELSEPDCVDNYGISKELGEPRNCMVLRTSVIGPEIKSHYSLLDWARNQRGTKVLGYNNHYWNGVTSLQYAKICEKIINENLWEKELRHIFGISYSKLEMLKIFNLVYDLKLEISDHQHDEQINRTLSTIYSLNSKLNIPRLDKMMIELRDFENG